MVFCFSFSLSWSLFSWLPGQYPQCLWLDENIWYPIFELATLWKLIICGQWLRRYLPCKTMTSRSWPDRERGATLHVTHSGFTAAKMNNNNRTVTTVLTSANSESIELILLCWPPHQNSSNKKINLLFYLNLDFIIILGDVRWRWPANCCCHAAGCRCCVMMLLQFIRA